jgi:signal transduction histidine kinase
VRELTVLRQKVAEIQGAEGVTQPSPESAEGLIEAIPTSLLILDTDLCVVAVTRYFCEFFQVTPEQAEGQYIYTLMEGQWDIAGLRELLAEALLKGTPLRGFEIEINVDRSEAKVVLLSTRRFEREGVGPNLLLEVQDVTEQRRAEREAIKREKRLQQTRHLAAVAELSAGAAHEVNNALGIISGFAELTLIEAISPKARHNIEIVLAETHRAAQTVHDLLSFSSERRPKLVPIAVKAFLEQVVSLKAPQYAQDNIYLRLQIAPDLPQIDGDRFQLVGLMMNILKNAQQAIAAIRGSGEVIIRARQVENTIRISTSDNGPGISPEHLDQIFNPFFTTQEVGKGTGLGLSIAYGIVRQHGGALWVESVLGEGATFHVELPISEAAGDLKPSVPEPTRVDGRLNPGPVKRILAVNDEPRMRELLAVALSSETHRVDWAKDGEEAWQMVQSQSYDCIVLNLLMPVMSGRQLYPLIKGYDHELAQRCIFITGALFNPEVQEFLEATGNPSLAKPFSLHDIRALVMEAIAS